MGYIKRISFLLLFTFIATSNSISQANTCETAPLLCSLSELNGYMATMPENNFTGEFNQSSMCPQGSDNPGGTNQNITWFSFIAGNATAQMVITFTNCMDGSGVDNFPQVQYGVYTDCNFSFNNNNTIVCEGGGGGVAIPSSGQITIDLGLTVPMIPGDDYFFFIDGDLGTFCDYEIEVTQGGWTNLLPDPTSLACLGDNCPPDGNLCSLGETLTFQPQDFELTIDYNWTVTDEDGNIIEMETYNPINTATFTFPNPGLYEICVIADNGCTMTNPVCYNLNVLGADAGTLDANPETLCPTETSTVTATNFFTTPPIEQAMIAVGPDGIVIGVIAGGIIDVTYDECGVVTVYSYNYLPSDAPGLPAVGSPFSAPNCNTNCCDIESIEVTFEDDQDPTFANVPIDITIECDDPIPPLPDVTWNDNCEGTGQVSGTQMDDYNTCMGGTITRTWSYTDLCDNNVEESQVITINAQMEGSFSSEPADETYDCVGDIPPPMDLTWTGACEGTATVSPVDGPEPDPCTGGTMTRAWSYNDPCGSFTEHVQTFTINTLPEGTFSNPPADETYDCVAEIPSPINLTWTGGCSGTATVTPVDGPEPNMCDGGIMTRTWSYTDVCVVTEYVQTFTINAASGGDFINPPGPITVQCDLSDLPPIPMLQWMGDCSGSAMVDGTDDVDIDACTGGTVIREWSFLDDCGAPANYFQLITVSPPPDALPVNPPPANIVLQCDEVPTTFPDLVFDNGQTGDCAIMGTAEPEVMGDPGTCGGPITVVWVYTDACFTPYTYVQNIVISPAASPEFVDPPGDMTISCLESLPVFPDLDYTNGETGVCALSGTEEASVNVDGDICGGDIVGIWQIPDPCNPGDFIEHIQTITIVPITEALWIDPPAETVTVQCSDATPPANDLFYTNSETGTCEIMGSVPADISGTSDVCGGEITYTWQFEDVCGRMLDHQQIITIEPASEPAFVTMPPDVTIGCDEIPPTPPSLDYTNGETGVCSISGSQTPVVNDNSNSCGGSITYTWEFTDPCGRPIDYMQTVTITEAPMADFIDPPAASITVDCNNIPAPAGPLSYTNSDACEIMGSVNPSINSNFDICGGTIINTWSFTDECGRLLEYIQTITVNPAPMAAFIDVPASTTVACGADATNPGNINYTNGESAGCLISGNVSPTQTGSYTACGGNIQFTWDFTDECGRPIQAVQSIVVEPAPAAAFINLPPADITVSCADFQSTPPSQSYTNGETALCLISGSVTGVLLGNANPCGNTVQYRWEFEDDCGRSITFNQNVTIELAPEATFTNPPGPITVDCNDVPNSAPNLSYANGESGVCAIVGSVPGIQSGVFTECGGSITYSWTFTDVCNRPISHSQVITVNPASDPVFLSPPADITLACGETFPVDPTLDYTNSEGGACSISGTITATSSVVGDVTTYTWSFTNACNGITIEETQNVTGVPTPDISLDQLQTTICLGESFDLSTITVTDATGNPITITYETGGSTITNPNVSPTGTTVYTIIASNAAGCMDDATFTINVDDPPFAGIAAGGQVCSQGGLSYNLFDYLSGSFTPGGTWFDTDNSGANIDNPIMATFGGVIADTYTFTYTVFSTNSCPNAEVEVEIEVISELEFEIFSIQCEPGGATYSINVISNGNSIFSNPGDVTVIDANNVIITNIPAGQNTIVSAIDANAFCISDQFVSFPDCDCPTIISPISNGDQVICQGDPTPELSVTVESGLIANWYPDQTSTTALIENSLVYTPTETAPGVYNYYVEAEDTDGCVSLIRTLVTLTINAKPDANSISYPVCPDDTGSASFDLQIINPLINSNASFTYEYYSTLLDAENETNVLNNAYVLSATTSIFVVVTNSTNCKEIAEVMLELSPLPTFTLEINNEVCKDSMDGSIIITDINPVGTTFSLDDITFEAVSSFDDLDVGNYTLYALSDIGCKTETNFEITPGIEIGYTELEITCNSNGTDTDSSDDFYTISFNANNNIGATNQVNVQSSSMDFGNFEYGDISFDIPIGSPEVITITDIVTGCSVEFATGDLTSCSTTCSVTIDQLDIFCNGGGTDADPTDDVYEITINASAINGSSNNTFNVTVDAAIVANFEYGIGGVITIPALGQTVIISIVDNADSQCFDSQSVGPLEPCSNECIISIDNHNFICDSGGTAGVPEDDTYLFSFTILATNSTATTFDLFVDNVNVGTFNYGEMSQYIMPADGMIHMIEFVDSNDDSCTVELTSPVLISCSGDCSINVVPQPAVCQNQNTGTDPTDDTFIADIFINVVGGSGTWTIIETAQTGNNGETVQVGPFLISDGDITLTIQDSGISGCTETIVIEAPGTCSACDDMVEAGENQFIDCTTIEATLTGTPTTNDIGTWTGPGGFEENMNEVIVTEAGMYFFTVDFGQGCILTDSAEVILTNLILNSENIQCNNGGTIDVQDDDTYTFTFNLSSTNPASTMYNLWVNGVIVGTYNYDEDSEYILPADGSTATFEFIDVDNITCIIQITSPELISCSSDCSISLVPQLAVCQNQNTGTDPSDDTYVADILINIVGGGNTWTILETSQTGNNGETVTLGPFLISDGDITLTIQDSGISSCFETITIEAPETCSACDDTVEAGDNQFIDCIITEATLTGVPTTTDIGTWTGPGGFEENMNEVIVTEAGMYYFTVDFGQGCILTDSAEVIITNLILNTENIQCNNGGTIGVPEDDTYIFTFNLSSTNTASTMYNLWVNGVSVETYSYGEDSEYILAADGSTPTLEFIDVDNNTCIVEVISPELISCSGECDITAVEQNIDCNNENTADDAADDTWTGEIVISQNGGSGTWTIVETSQTGNPGEAISIGPYLILDGPVTFTINDTGIAGCGTTITISPPPTCSNCNESVEAGVDVTLDCVITEADLIGVPSSPTTGIWTGPGGFTFNGNEVTVTIPGTYYYTADYGANCIRIDSLEIDVSNEVPAVFTGDNQSLTCLIDSVTLTGTVTGGSGNFTYQWLDNTMAEISTDLSITVGVAGNYFFVVYDIDSDCTSPPSLVEVLDETADLLPQINADPSFILNCQVDKITLTVVEEPNVEYKWFVGSVLITGITTSLIISDAGTFRLEATHTITGCKGMKELVIENQIEYPISFIQPAEILDCDNGFINLDGSSSQTGTSITYTWLDLDSMVIATGVNNLDVSEGGTYYLQLLDVDNNCINFDTVLVTSNIDLPEIALDEEAIINCDEDDIAVALTTVIDPTMFTINWQTANGNIISGGDTSEITVGSEGLYTVSVINPENNCETIDSIEISLPEPIESSTYAIEDESCEESNNGEISITAVQGGTGPYTYFIDDNEITDNTLDNLMEGTYNLLIVDDNGCEFNDQIVVELQEPFAVNLLSEVTVIQGQTTQLVASVNLSDSEIESIVWSPDTNLSCPTCLTTEVTGGIGDIVYTIGITDINGCYAEAMITVRSNEEIVITIPNIFKPNNQGTGNNNFTIYSTVDATINKIQVFDRWGNMMFISENIETNNPVLGWDGKYNNTYVEQGVFVYYAEILIGEKVIIKKGDITVLR